MTHRARDTSRGLWAALGAALALACGACIPEIPALGEHGGALGTDAGTDGGGADGGGDAGGGSDAPTGADAGGDTSDTGAGGGDVSDAASPGPDGASPDVGVDAALADTGADGAAPDAADAPDGAPLPDTADVATPDTADAADAASTDAADAAAPDTADAADAGSPTCLPDWGCPAPESPCEIPACNDGACSPTQAPDGVPCAGTAGCTTAKPCACGDGTCAGAGSYHAADLVFAAVSPSLAPLSLSADDRIVQVAQGETPEAVVVVVERATPGAPLLYASDPALSSFAVLGDGPDAAAFPGGSFSEPFLARVPGGWTLYATATGPEPCESSVYVSTSTDLQAWSKPAVAIACAQEGALDAKAARTPSLFVTGPDAGVLYYFGVAGDGAERALVATTTDFGTFTFAAAHTEPAAGQPPYVRALATGYALGGAIHLLSCNLESSSCRFLAAMLGKPETPFLPQGFCLAGTAGHRALGMAFVGGEVRAWTALGTGPGTQLLRATATTFTKTSGCG